MIVIRFDCLMRDLKPVLGKPVEEWLAQEIESQARLGFTLHSFQFSQVVINDERDVHEALIAVFRKQ